MNFLQTRAGIGGPPVSRTRHQRIMSPRRTTRTTAGRASQRCAGCLDSAKCAGCVKFSPTKNDQTQPGLTVSRKVFEIQRRESQQQCRQKPSRNPVSHSLEPFF